MSELKALSISAVAYLIVFVVMQFILPGQYDYNCNAAESLCAQDPFVVLRRIILLVLSPIIVVILPVILIKLSKKLPKKG